MHILVVEDERILCETIARSLKRLAYSVDCCYDGITAMQMLADDNFDLVVLDLNLPGADGIWYLHVINPFVKILSSKQFQKRKIIIHLNSNIIPSWCSLTIHIWIIVS